MLTILPAALMVGTLLPLAISVSSRFLLREGPATEMESYVRMVDILACAGIPATVRARFTCLPGTVPGISSMHLQAFGALYRGPSGVYSSRKSLIGTILGEWPAAFPPGRGHRFSKKEITMKLVYDVIEDVYDDTTQIRTMSEQAKLPSGDWLIRTTLYTPHHIGTDVCIVKGKKGKKSLFEAVR